MVNPTVTDPIHTLIGNMIKLVKMLTEIKPGSTDIIYTYSPFSLGYSIARSTSFTPFHVASSCCIGIATLCVRLENR